LWWWWWWWWWWMMMMMNDDEWWWRWFPSGFWLDLMTTLHQVGTTSDASCKQTNVFVQQKTTFLAYRAKGPSTVSRDRPLAFVFTGLSWDLDVWVVWSSVEWTRYILLVWFDQLLEVWIPFLPICSCQTPLASTISTPWLCSWYVFHFSCSLYWCNMLTQFDTIPCGCSLAVDD
jgi:hypothetical protein